MRATLQKIGQIPAAADLRVSGGFSGVNVSKVTYEETQHCLFAALYREAKARADTMALDAGVGSGRVLAIADTNLLAPYAALFATAETTFFVTLRVAIE